MKINEVRELIKFRPPRLDRTAARLDQCRTIEDLQKIARRKLPRSVYDYVEGGADEEHTVAENVAAYRRHRFTPTVLTDVSVADTTADILGSVASAPLGFAPTGYTRMLSPQGEPAVAASAARAGIPYVLSTMATTALEDIAENPATSSADRWFQLYIWKDRALTESLVQRAGDAGYRVLEIAVDTAVSGYRVRDVRNGFTIPPQLNFKSVLDIGTRPGYWTKMLANPSLEFANVSAAASSEGEGFTIENITKQFDPAVTWSDLARIREQWSGKLVVKGPVGPDDAVRARDLGVDAVHLSNHGGRQLDRAIAPIDLVKPVREAVGSDFGILVDSGVRHGSDIATAVALGADAAFVGRAYLWGLIAGGSDGVDKTAGLLIDQLRRTMQLLGVSSVTELRKRGHELLAQN